MGDTTNANTHSLRDLHPQTQTLDINLGGGYPSPVHDSNGNSNNNNNDNNNSNDTNNKTELSTYVFSPNFYLRKTDKMTPLELETFKYVCGEQLDIDTVMKLYQESPSWSTRDKYYYLPILILLLKECKASLKTQI